jgi:hypothetical protein
MNKNDRQADAYRSFHAFRLVIGSCLMLAAVKDIFGTPRDAHNARRVDGHRKEANGRFRLSMTMIYDARCFIVSSEIGIE